MDRLEGLSQEEVAQKIQEGKQNKVTIKTEKSLGQIIRDNLFTYFNLIFLILAIIIISIFSIIKSCQRSKREVINVYTDREIEIFVDKLAKKYERIDKETEIRLNSLKSIEDYDIILVNEDSKIKDNIKKKYEVKDFFEDSLVIIGRRRIDNLSQMLTSSIAIPNYKTNIGKTGLDILAKVEGFQEMAKKIQYKDDVMSALESVDLYEVDYAFVTSKILPLAKNSELCYVFPDNMGRSKILYKAYINLESKKNPKKFYDFIEEDLADKTILKPNPEKNKVIKTN